MIGREMKYCLGGLVKCRGIVQELRWSSATIAKIKLGRIVKPEYYGIEIKIKPNNGKRAIWSRAFNSGVKVK